MKQDKRPRGMVPTEAPPPAKPLDRDAQTGDAAQPELHSGRGADSALEKMKKLERQRARSRGGVERPLC